MPTIQPVLTYDLLRLVNPMTKKKPADNNPAIRMRAFKIIEIIYQIRTGLCLMSEINKKPSSSEGFMFTIFDC